MPLYCVEGKVQVAVTMKVNAINRKAALENAALLWAGLNDCHTGKAVGVFDDDHLDPRICEDGSEPDWIDAEKIKDSGKEGG